MTAPMQFVTEPCAGRPGPAIRAALVLVGFSAIIGQIVLMREMIVAFSGNELSLGMMLATWLGWTAMGSGIASRLTVGKSQGRRTVAGLECLLGLSLLPTIWMLRVSRVLFQVVPGELVGPVPTLLTCVMCLSVFCALSGFLFVAASRMYQEECAASRRVATSSAYLFDAAGSALGGILASLVLLRFLESFQIAILVTLVNLCMAAILFSRAIRRGVLAVALAGTVLAIPLINYVAPSLSKTSQYRLWRGFHVLGSHDSIYGNLAVIETGNIRSIYDNGAILASAPDEASAEEAIHYALLEHPAPKQVLLIGGGVNGSIGQALKHPSVERLDYVELDPALIEMTMQFFPAQAAALSDPRVHIHYADGRRYLKTTTDMFDVIILDLPEPQTAQLNRFYTEEFFRSGLDHLAPGGLFALQLRSSEDYISPELAELLRCIQHTLRQAFPYTSVIPGETIHFFGALQAGVLTDDPRMLISRLRSRNIDTQYVREYFIPFRMMPDRMEQIRELLQPLPTTSINRDLEPIAYYYDVVLWSAQFKSAYARWFRIAGHTGFMSVILGALVILLTAAAIVAYPQGRTTRARASAVYCVGMTGFTLMALQIFILLAFQSVYGYVYHQLAILIAMLMAGIALGSWLGIRQMRQGNRQPVRRMTATQFVVAISGPALVLSVSVLSRISNLADARLTAQLVFPAVAVGSGMLGGYQFPIATEVYLCDGGPSPRQGALYAIDLVGGCIGALLLCTYLIPIFGFWRTAWLTAAVNLVPALLATRIALEAKAHPA